MQDAFLHRPYEGRAQPFSIGLRPIEASAWIIPDAARQSELALKRDLLASRRDVVVREKADTRAAQAELLALLGAHLAADHGFAPVAPADRAPIVSAALLVQDDLVLMRKGADGWRLAAACLCFPSTWSLAEKFDRPMEAIHADVPGYAGQMAHRVNRIFDHLAAGTIVERFNWSIYADDILHHPEPKSGPRPWAGDVRRFMGQGFVRVERQTLRRLPRSGDIAFTIKVQADPVAALRRHPDGPALAAALHGQLAAMTAEQLAYKNMLADRDALLSGLSELVRG